VRELLEYLPSRLHGVHLLGAEELLHELLRQHRLHHVLQHLLRTLAPDLLGTEALVQDIDHLPAQV